MLLSLFFSLIRPTHSCSAGTGGLRDSEIITDPTFTMTLSPPVSWTYPSLPGTTTGAQTPSYFFPGQSLTADQAQQMATNEMNAAFLEALNSSPYPIRNAELTSTYSPDEISNCYTGTQIPAGTKVGLLSGGAVAEYVVVPSQATTIAQCPVTPNANNFGPYEQYIKTVTATAKNTPAMSRYEWERIANNMMSTLSFRYRAQFRSQMIIT